jgi:hypothetical protein
MLKTSLFFLFLFLTINILAAQEQNKLEYIEEINNKSDIGSVILNVAVMHDFRDTVSGFRPKNFLEVTGVGENLKMKLYTVYFNTNIHTTISSKHIQKVELVSPDETKKYYSGEDFVVFETFQGKYGSCQRAYLDQMLVFPELSPAVAKNFGFYRLKIYLDGQLMKNFLVPIITSYE